ncbi:rhodanese-like domain-containing protein [soil metagenome]
MIEQFFEFVVHHWALWSLFAITLALLIWQELRTQIGGVQQLSPQAVVDLINHKNAAVIDIRPNANYVKGHILGAVNIPIETLDQKNKTLDKYRKNPLILTCDTGQQSLKEAIKLRKLGFTEIYTLRGGMAAWKNATLPLDIK